MPHGDGTPTGAEHRIAARRHLTEAKIDAERRHTEAATALALVGIGHALMALLEAVDDLPERMVGRVWTGGSL